MAKNKKLAEPKDNERGSGKIKVPEIGTNFNELPPVFSLEHLCNGDYCLSKLDTRDKAKFADAIYRRKDIKWGELLNADRHGVGVEKIPRNSIKAPIPERITADQDHFLAFRFSGLKPMVGHLSTHERN